MTEKPLFLHVGQLNTEIRYRWVGIPLSTLFVFQNEGKMVSTFLGKEYARLLSLGARARAAGDTEGFRRAVSRLGSYSYCPPVSLLM